MIRTLLLDGVFAERDLEGCDAIRRALERQLPALAAIPLRGVIALLTQLGRDLAKRPLGSGESTPYLSLWLRRTHLERICRLNYGADHYFEEFAPTDLGFEMCARQRGIVCHWIAGNTPGLAFFSLMLCMLSRNASVLKVPEAGLSALLGLLERLNEIEIEHDRGTLRGCDLVRGVAVVAFAGRDPVPNAELSRIADAKIVWGDAEAVRSVTALPQREHCEIVAFGPKYSFAVFDRDFIGSAGFDEALVAAATDAVLFNQQACSSPHVLFFERGVLEQAEIADRLRFAFESLPRKFLEQPLDPATAARVINARGLHLLDGEREIRIPRDLAWTILVDPRPGLEEPVQGRCVYLKLVDSIDDVLPEITRKVQAVGIGVADERRRREFACAATAHGVDRVVAVGKMHDFDLPWDGVLALNRLVRWVILKA